MFATISDRITRRASTDSDDSDDSDDSGDDGDGPHSLRIDEYLPDYDAVSRRHIVVDAPPVETYDAALAADLTRLGPAVGLLGALRALPIRLGAWLRGESAPDPESFTFGDLPPRGTWVRLDASSPEEFVFGAVGKVWKPNIEWVELDVRSFEAFDQPGYAKIVAGLSFRPYGTGRTLLTYEARTAATDTVATRQFVRYWGLVRPFVNYILGRALLRIKHDAEAGAAE